MATNLLDRLKMLEQIERDIAVALESAGYAVAELSKDKPNQKTTEGHVNTFLKTVNGIESNLLKQLNHLSQVVTTHPHTGSAYGAQKDYQMESQRMDYLTSRLDDLEKLKQEQLSSSYKKSELRRALSHHSNFPPIGNGGNQ